MRAFPLLAACLVLSTPVAAESLGEKTGVNSVLNIAPKTADFVTEAASSDMFEIQSSQLALERSDSATKTFAQRMIDDHTKTSDEIKTLAKGANVTVPTAMDSSHQSMLDKLKGLKGNDFTKQYHDDQVSAHKDAVSLFERYAKGGNNAGLKSFASKTLPILRDHLKHAEELDK